MEFDFGKSFAPYSNIELLKIIREPGQYQEEAVAAAEKLLESRVVTDEDRISAGYIIESPTDNILETDRKSFPAAGADLLSSFDPDSADSRPPNIYKITLGLAVVLNLLFAYSSAVNLYTLVIYGGRDWTVVMISCLYICIMPFAVFALFKRKAVGWYVIFAENVLSGFYTVLYFVNYRINFHISYALVTFFAISLMRATIIILLWQRNTATVTGVTTRQKAVSLLVCVGLVVLFKALTVFLESGRSI